MKFKYLGAKYLMNFDVYSYKINGSIVEVYLKHVGQPEFSVIRDGTMEFKGSREEFMEKYPYFAHEFGFGIPTKKRLRKVR